MVEKEKNKPFNQFEGLDDLLAGYYKNPEVAVGFLVDKLHNLDKDTDEMHPELLEKISGTYQLIHNDLKDIVTRDKRDSTTSKGKESKLEEIAVKGIMSILSETEYGSKRLKSIMSDDNYTFDEKKRLLAKEASSLHTDEQGREIMDYGSLLENITRGTARISEIYNHFDTPTRLQAMKNHYKVTITQKIGSIVDKNVSLSYLKKVYAQKNWLKYTAGMESAHQLDHLRAAGHAKHHTFKNAEHAQRLHTDFDQTKYTSQMGKYHAREEKENKKAA